MSENNLESLQSVLKPYQQVQNQRQRRIDLMKKILRSVEKDDFFQLDEFLKSSLAQQVELDPELSEVRPLFDQFRVEVNEKIDQYRVQFSEELEKLAQEYDLPIQIDLPRISSLTGIEGTEKFSERQVLLNGKVIKYLDPRKVVAA